MASKYAKARDTAFQWRSEYHKVRRENRSLRKVYAAARTLTRAMAEGADHNGPLLDLREALDRSVFAAVPEKG